MFLVHVTKNKSVVLCFHSQQNGNVVVIIVFKYKSKGAKL